MTGLPVVLGAVNVAAAEHAHVRWTTLTDPEQNLFCVAEHPPSPSGGSR